MMHIRVVNNGEISKANVLFSWAQSHRKHMEMPIRGMTETPVASKLSGHAPISVGCHFVPDGIASVNGDATPGSIS
jgi:hypothetical protein